jgi:hypothetical protein
MSTFRVFNASGNTLVLNSSDKLEYLDPSEVLANKPENQIAFFFQYGQSNTSATFIFRELRMYRKNGKLLGDRENAYP